MKKQKFTTFIIILVVLLPLLASIKVAQAENSNNNCSLPSGEPYTHPKTNTVWLITKRGTRRPFQSSKMYNTYFSDWSKVKGVSKSKVKNCKKDVAGFVPFGSRSKKLGYMKGGALVKIPTDNRVYLLLDEKNIG